MRETPTRARRKVRTGTVTSNKMQRTIVVAVRRRLRHPLYAKYITRTAKLMADDPKGECAIGDIVRIMETRPLSRRKRWRLVEILRKAEQV